MCYSLIPDNITCTNYVEREKCPFLFHGIKFPWGKLNIKCCTYKREDELNRGATKGDFVVVYHANNVKIGHVMSMKFGPMVIVSVLRTAGI